MSTVTVRFRGICCFIDPTNGESFKKRVVLPNADNHRHSVIEQHIPIIEFLADDLKSAPPDMERIAYTRPGDDGQYERIEIKKPVCIEIERASRQGQITPINLDESMIHLDDLLAPLQLKKTLLGPAENVSGALVSAVMDLPDGMLIAGPPESTKTTFPSGVKFKERRIPRWLEHITKVDGDFRLKLTPLGDPNAVPQYISFKESTGLVTIANEPLRMTVGHFVPPDPAGKHKQDPTVHDGHASPPQPTGHFDMYWDLIADPPESRPVPVPFQGTGPGCAPANKP